MTTLDGIEHTFGPEHLLITDPGGPVAVAGVMGGLETEVTENTKNILLEVAKFNQVNIRRTAMALKAQSEASKRFAWGLPQELAVITSRRCTKLLVELAGGKAAQGHHRRLSRQSGEGRDRARAETTSASPRD